MITMGSIHASSPFPWTSQVNYDGQGGCRMVHAAGAEVPLFSVMAVASITTTTIAPQTPAQAKEGAAA